MRIMILALASFVMSSACASAQEPSQKEDPVTTVNIKYTEQNGNISVTVEGSVTMEGTVIVGTVGDTWRVQAWCQSMEKKVPRFFTGTITPTSLSLAGIHCPIVSVDDGGRSFKDPGQRQWTLVKGDNPLSMPKDGDDLAPLMLKGKKVWHKDRPDTLDFMDDTGRTWRFVVPEDEK